jgi:hypothetical protein
MLYPTLYLFEKVRSWTEGTGNRFKVLLKSLYVSESMKVAPGGSHLSLRERLLKEQVVTFAKIY